MYIPKLPKWVTKPEIVGFCDEKSSDVTEASPLGPPCRQPRIITLVRFRWYSLDRRGKCEVRYGTASDGICLRRFLSVD